MKLEMLTRINLQWATEKEEIQVIGFACIAKCYTNTLLCLMMGKDRGTEDF